MYMNEEFCDKSVASQGNRLLVHNCIHTVPLLLGSLKNKLLVRASNLIVVAF